MEDERVLIELSLFSLSFSLSLCLSLSLSLIHTHAHCLSRTLPAYCLLLVLTVLPTSTY